MPPKEAQAKAHVSARGLKRARAAAEPQGPVHAEDVERLVLEGKRSWLYNHFHLRKECEVGWEKIFFCNVCCSGKRGTVDAKEGKIYLKNAAMNPMQRHLEKHGISKATVAEQSGQPSILSHMKHPKSRNEKLLDFFAERVLVKHGQPVSLYEHEGFREFCHELDARFHFCSRKKMSSKVLPRVLDHLEEDGQSCPESVEQIGFGNRLNMFKPNV